MDTQADAVRDPSATGTVRDPSAGQPADGSGRPAPAKAAPSAASGAGTAGAPAKKAAAKKAPAKKAATAKKAAAPAKKAATKKAAPAKKAATPPPRPALPTAPGIPTAADVVAGRDGRAVVEDHNPDLPGLLETSERLREEVSALNLPLVVPEVDQARVDRERLLAQLDDYLLPRLRRMDAPLLAVIGGSTGAGKSTLTNSLVRKEVTRSGVLRPTTRSPVLVHHPYDSGAFLSQRILPKLARVTAEAPEPMQPIDVDAPRITALRLVPHEGVPAGLAIIDAPDIDSVVDTNRELAVQLLAAADLWLFVTTAARYADAVPWEMLRTAVDRGASVAIILDRVPRESLQEVRVHLATLLRDRGLASSPMFTIPESPLVDGFLPAEVVRPLMGWLTRLARDARARDVIVRRTLAGALDSLRDRVHVVADAADRQRDAAAALRTDLDATFDTAAEDLRRKLVDGTILRGEVLARWQEFVGTGEFMRAIESNMGRIRDRLSRAKPAPTEPLGEALETGLAAMVRASALATLEQSVLRWRDVPAGEAILKGAARSTLAPDFDARLTREVQYWRHDVRGLVEAEGQTRRLSARAQQLGPDGTATILMLVVFGQLVADQARGDGGADGTAALAQRILDSVYGAPSVRALTAKAHAELVARVDALLETERRRMTGLLDALGILPAAGDRLRTAVASIEDAR